MGTAALPLARAGPGLRGDRAVSDLYSIGVILYEALTGRVPFEGDSAVAVAMKQVSQTPQRPSAINPQVSPALDAVVMRALEKDPGARFQTPTPSSPRSTRPSATPGEAAAPDTAAFAAAAARGRGEWRRRGARRRGRGARAAAAGWIAGRSLALLVAGVAALIGFALTRDTTSADVPQVTGNSAPNVAIALPRADGLRSAEIKPGQREAPRDTVLEQDPPSPARQVARLRLPHLLLLEAEVTLTVSAGPGSAKVPDVAGLSEQRREEAAGGGGLRGRTADVRLGSRAEAGEVIGTDPDAGAKTPTRLDRHPARLARDRSWSRCRAWSACRPTPRSPQPIRGRGFERQRRPAARTSAPSGEVIGQSPSAGGRW